MSEVRVETETKKEASPEVQRAASEIIRRGRTHLVLRNPFFATLVLGMDCQNGAKMGTMETDGQTIWFDDEWTAKLTLEECMGVLAHEALHSGLLHPFRTKKGGYLQNKSNIAQDLVINLILKDEGFVLPGQPVTWEEMMAGAKGHLYDKKYKGMSFEEIYRLLKEPPGGWGSSMKVLIQGGSKGLGQDVIPSDSPEGETEAKIRVSQAATVAKQQGKLPAGLKDLLESMMEPKVDWRDILRQYFKNRKKDDYDARRHNRRLVPSDIYFPGMYSETMGELVVSIDTSGSTMPDREQFLGEVVSIAQEVRPSKLHVLYCDARVERAITLSPSEYDLAFEECRTFGGGGGTSFVPPFKWIEEKGIVPEAHIYLTDMYGTFPTEPTPYETIWVSTSGPQGPKPPFGMVIPMERDEK